MVPFMFMQSAAMALAFGSFFQYGKRSVSAMSNEEFNALTPEALTANLMSSVNNMIPTVQQSFHQMEQMNVMILDAMAKYFNQALDKLEEWIGQGATRFTNRVQDASGYISDDTAFLESQNIIPPVGGEDYQPSTQTRTNQPTYTAVEQFAQRWIRADGSQANFSTITEPEAVYLLKQIQQGNLDRYKSWRRQLLDKLATFTQPTTPTPTQQQQTTQAAIEQTSSGITRQIATMYNLLVFHLQRRRRLVNNRSQQHQFNALTRAFRNEAQAYNRFVQLHRRRNLTVDIDKSLARSAIIPRYT